MTSVPIDLDWEKMIVLLDRFRTRRPSRQEAGIRTLAQKIL